MFPNNKMTILSFAAFAVLKGVHAEKEVAETLGLLALPALLNGGVGVPGAVGPTVSVGVGVGNGLYGTGVNVGANVLGIGANVGVGAPSCRDERGYSTDNHAYSTRASNPTTTTETNGDGSASTKTNSASATASANTIATTSASASAKATASANANADAKAGTTGTGTSGTSATSQKAYRQLRSIE
ncbi:hypothetical protein JG688_00015675 [Phytophthora aleatoria]|uniref:Uncharacterized protein n=1 Tax=Phytophthora aleatoria TaxID=2496075 RepID=A0A8J5LWP2_9STRA|nr:hypothetical protein JG688_00015675 [Phytophthora aleatoria]